jgi:tRNA-dihydrouridine synthase
MARETGCDGVMVGRASLGNPWLLSAIRARWRPLSTDAAPPGDWRDYLEAALGHVSDFLEEKPRCVGHARMLFIWYSRGCPEAGRLRGSLMQTNKIDDLFELFRRWVGEVESKGISFLSAKISNTAPARWNDDDLGDEHP